MASDCDKCNGLEAKLLEKQQDIDKLKNEVTFKTAYLFEERSLYLKLQQEFEDFKRLHEKCNGTGGSEKASGEEGKIIEGLRKELAEKDRTIAELTMKMEKKKSSASLPQLDRQKNTTSRKKKKERTVTPEVRTDSPVKLPDARTDSPVNIAALGGAEQENTESEVDNKEGYSDGKSDNSESVLDKKEELEDSSSMVGEVAPLSSSSTQPRISESGENVSEVEVEKLGGALAGGESRPTPLGHTMTEKRFVVGEKRAEGIGELKSSVSINAFSKGAPPNDERKRFFTASSLSTGNMIKPVVVPKKKENQDKVENDLVMFSKNFQVQIKGGTLPKIIERCTNESATDNNFVDTFLLTYRTYLNAGELLEMLFERYNIPDPQGVEDVALQQFNEARKIIRLRVGNLIKRWLTHHFHDFNDNPEILNRLTDFVNSTYMNTDPSLGKSIIGQIDNSRKTKERENSFSSPPPKSIIPTKDSFDDFDPVEVARQLCIFEQQMFKSIHTKECLNQGWNSKTNEKKLELSPNVTRMIRHFNDVSFWVQAQILSQKKLDLRVKMMKKFIKIMKASREFNNFNLIQEILAGFAGNAIFRLKKTWAKIEKEKKVFDEYSQLKATLAQDHNYKTYRDVLKEVNPPCLPYLGVFLTDLTFLEDGNPNILPLEGRNDIINFEKMRKVSVVIQRIVIYQQQPYNFTKVDMIYNYFDSLASKTMTEAELYSLSLEVEPRE
eukprot:TRINITY_DN7215_c0_g3_i1.p1 TRINITY_DN7215_c0_g3~~TRINITY_DN7215_c0_g3_i1.p1  ORF type:complete len:724 (+),score=135.44 TRINITY_DN7215_c0_g3_i1:79-2250(+)